MEVITITKTDRVCSVLLDCLQTIATVHRSQLEWWLHEERVKSHQNHNGV